MKPSEPSAKTSEIWKLIKSEKVNPFVHMMVIHWKMKRRFQLWRAVQKKSSRNWDGKGRDPEAIPGVDTVQANSNSHRRFTFLFHPSNHYLKRSIPRWFFCTVLHSWKRRFIFQWITIICTSGFTFSDLINFQISEVFADGSDGFTHLNSIILFSIAVSSRL